MGKGFSMTTIGPQPFPHQSPIPLHPCPSPIVLHLSLALGSVTKRKIEALGRRDERWSSRESEAGL